MMPKYLFHRSYTVEGARKLLNERGSARRSHHEVYGCRLGYYGIVLLFKIRLKLYKIKDFTEG
ncbi:MAG: hypothetical protein CVV49_17865 [Spirochaetae bacterium HGW-Spirochaetae-5]|nr:MAG: hypothetical protein CVV49_17865 [Spirochaetae bacterium HGW-Spirochaetae-5]